LVDLQHQLQVSAPHTSFAMFLSRDSIAGHVLRDFLVVLLTVSVWRSKTVVDAW
jgi:hypothetical protein